MTSVMISRHTTAEIPSTTQMQAFWQQVGLCMTRVLNADSTTATKKIADYQKSIGQSPSELALAYHESPLSAAAGLLNQSITSSHRDLYASLCHPAPK